MEPGRGLEPLTRSLQNCLLNLNMQHMGIYGVHSTPQQPQEIRCSRCVSLHERAAAWSKPAARRSYLAWNSLPLRRLLVSPHLRDARVRNANAQRGSAVSTESKNPNEECEIRAD